MAKQAVFWATTLRECPDGKRERILNIQPIILNKWYDFKNILSFKIQNTGGDVIYVFRDNTYFEVQLNTPYFELISESPYPLDGLRVMFSNTTTQPV